MNYLFLKYGKYFKMINIKDKIDQYRVLIRNNYEISIQEQIEVELMN